MPNAVLRASNAVVKVDSVTIAKVTSMRNSYSLTEEDATGVEDVSGDLVNEQFEPVAVGQTYRITGIVKDGSGEGTPQEYEPGLQDLRTAMKNGTEAVLQVLDKNGFGENATGYFTSLEIGFESVRGLFDFTADFRVNSTAAVTP